MEDLGSNRSLVLAFPAALRDDAVRATEAMAPAHLAPIVHFCVSVSGERVTIPYRVYNPEPDPGVVAPLAPVQRAILSCLYSRHHDGFVRERTVESLLRSDDPWVIPFVVQLVGEYVVEIVELIERGLTARSDLAPYERFASENPEFVGLTRKRAVSYWDCYYRDRYPDARSYPGLRAMALITGRRVEPEV